MKQLNVESCKESIRTLMGACLMDSPLGELAARYAPAIQSGKMLRGLMVFRVGGATGVPDKHLLSAAAAVEMIHAASLLHDDVIDGAELRRGAPSFWKAYGAQGAILMGDMLMFKALELIHTLDDSRLMGLLIEQTGEVCMAEVEQELILRKKKAAFDKTLDIARRKTGALFAFGAAAAAGGDEALRDALREAGYQFGTAYQLADDFYDRYGSEHEADKTLGTDRERAKPTTENHDGDKQRQQSIERIRSMIVGSADLLSDWPDVREAWHTYIREDAASAFSTFLESTL